MTLLKQKQVDGLSTALADKLPLAGGTLTGDLTLNADPDSALKAATKQYVDARVASQVAYKGGYNASTNTPDLDSAPSGIDIGFMYTVTAAGTFFSVALEVGDVIISEQNNPTVEADWTVVNRDLTAADITNTTNVTAAGALMDSEIANLADLKAFDPADYALAGSISATVTEEDDVCPVTAASTNFNVTLGTAPTGGIAGVTSVHINGAGVSAAELISVTTVTMVLNVPYAVDATDIVTTRYF
jgi:hypothetical protein